ncbi:unnamed protein product [Lota lota]
MHGTNTKNGVVQRKEEAVMTAYRDGLGSGRRPASDWCAGRKRLWVNMRHRTNLKADQMSCFRSGASDQVHITSEREFDGDDMALRPGRPVLMNHEDRLRTPRPTWWQCMGVPLYSSEVHRQQARALLVSVF